MFPVSPFLGSEHMAKVKKFNAEVEVSTGWIPVIHKNSTVMKMRQRALWGPGIPPI
jgi:hypothetical protein